MLSSAGCLSGEVATSAGPVGGPCTTPRRCSVTAGASTAAASCAVSLSELGLGVGASIHLLQEEAASVNKADTSSVWFCLSGLLDSACAQPPTRTASHSACVPTALPLHSAPMHVIGCHVCLPCCTQSARVSVVWCPAQSLAHPRGLAPIPG